MTRLRTLGFVAAFLLQTALLGWMIGDRAMLLASGNEIRLDVIPVDPRDLFRGHYVVLAYDISRLKASALAGDRDIFFGDRVYVALTPEGSTWKAVGIYLSPPSEGTYLAGTIADARQESPGCTPPCSEYDVDYGLEQFFVPEGEGRELERLRNDQKVSVDVAVGANGRAALKRLLVDGTVRYEEPAL